MFSIFITMSYKVSETTFINLSALSSFSERFALTSRVISDINFALFASSLSTCVWMELLALSKCAINSMQAPVNFLFASVVYYFRDSTSFFCSIAYSITSYIAFIITQDIFFQVSGMMLTMLSSPKSSSLRWSIFGISVMFYNDCPSCIVRELRLLPAPPPVAAALAVFLFPPRINLIIEIKYK